MTLKADYSYDIPLDDLRRYRRLPPAVILQWLEDAQEFVAKVVQPNLKSFRARGQEP